MVHDQRQEAPQPLIARTGAAPLRRALYLQHTNPAGYPPLEHSSRILADSGWQVQFLGVDVGGTSALRFPPHPAVAVALLPHSPRGWRQKRQYLQFCAWALLWAARWRPRLIYASDALACPAALPLSYLPGVRVIYHEHDSPEHAPGEAPPSAFMRSVLWARRRLARRAWLAVLPGRGRVEPFVAETGIDAERTRSVWNCPARDEVGPPRDDPPGPTLRLIYHGSIVPSRLPETVVRAIAELPGRVSLAIVGYETVGAPGYVRQLKALAAQLGVADQVEVVGAVPTRHDLYACCRQADIGVALMPNDTMSLNERTMLAGASNKIFDYLACGLVALVPEQPELRSLYVEPGYARACNPADPASIAAALRWWLSHPAELREMGERGRRRILAEWHYERQFEPVLQAIGRP